MLRGLSIEEALKQLSFPTKISPKGCVIAKEVLEEAQEKAMKEHNFEFATNMWVAEAFTNQAQIVKSMRRHARMRFGIIKHRYINFYVRLEEGKPPKHYEEWKQDHWNSHQWLEHYMKEHRKKTVPLY